MSSRWHLHFVVHVSPSELDWVSIEFNRDRQTVRLNRIRHEWFSSMNLSDAIHFSLKRIEIELFSPGSVFSIYSLAISFSCALFILSLSRYRRRGIVNLRALWRAIFSRNLLNRDSTIADINLFMKPQLSNIFAY